jgi:rubrerythrin
MDWRLFLSTFLLIFLAELGDKTQLASMAASAGSKSPWSVFAGASVALVLSTLIAILLGSTLQRVVPPHVLKFGAAILFFAFGAVLLIAALRKPTEEAAPTAARAPGVMARLVMAAAADFERAAAEDYERLARESGSQRVRDLFLHLASEERSHLERVAHLADSHAEDAWHTTEEAPEGDVLSSTDESDDLVREAIDHERKTASFYRELSRTAPLPALQGAFAALADEEESHVAHLEEYLESGHVNI